MIRTVGFSEPTGKWFAESFGEATVAQRRAWDVIARGRHTLVIAPTGSGKTLAAFLWAIDRLLAHPVTARGTRVLYVSPMKALAVDVDRNLRAPLTGISRLLPEPPGISVGVRTGDTSERERRRLVKHPPEILITTPESLYLMLTSRARDTLADVTTVIVDEIHAVAGTKRGSHLALSLERLERITRSAPQRIGLSATVRPAEVVAEFLGGDREVEIVTAPEAKSLELSIRVPIPDLANPPEVSATETGRSGPSVWPHVEESIVDTIADHGSTLVFANSRRLAERLTTRINELWSSRQQVALSPGHPPPTTPPAEVPGASGQTDGAEPVLARAHHGSVSREQRLRIEDDLKSGRLRAVVATNSLELGIDMGLVDLVIQVQAPPGVASGLQRVGRAGHHVGATSKAFVYPTHRGDLLAAAVTLDLMRAGEIEPIRPPRHPLDVLAQQIVAMVAMDDWHVDQLFRILRRSGPYAELPRSAFDSVVDMLIGAYPSEEFAALRPKLTLDRGNGVLRARPGCQRIAVTSGGTIPDRGHFGVFLIAGEGSSRVGELDEEMVYESRVGDVFALGSTSWRIADITPDRVLVTPAPGHAARLPFWHGDAIGRSSELGVAIASRLRAFLSDAFDPRSDGGLDAFAADNLASYLDEQTEATGTLPTDRTVLVEEFTDEIGDRRVAIHSPRGARVHAPWGLVIADRLRRRFGIDAQMMPADDGIVLRLPDDGSDELLSSDTLLLDPEEVTDTVTRLIGGSALFASRFRECAARSLLFPRRDPTRRSPLWQQRQRASQLMGVAAEYGTFPVVLETVRECLQDVYDLPALVDLMRRIGSGEVDVVSVRTTRPSPFARSLMFGYVAQFLYEGDTPLAERKSAALALDDALLTELLGTADLRALLDPDALAIVESRLQHLGDRAARDVESAWDVLRTVGPLRGDECDPRGIDQDSRTELLNAGRAFPYRRAGSEWWAVVEDAGRLRDALGIELPATIPQALGAASPNALPDLVTRYAKTHGPFTTDDLADRFGLGRQVVSRLLSDAVRSGALLSGAFRPGGQGAEWCRPESLRAIRRASAARYRRESEPVSPSTLPSFATSWQAVGPLGSGPGRRGVDGLLATIEQLAGAPLPASQLETLVLPGRVRDYAPGMLDELTTSGEVVWWGIAELPRDGWIALAPADLAGSLLPEPRDPADDFESVVLELLAAGGGWFLPQLRERLDSAVSVGESVEAAVWRLLWAGQVTNDTVGPLRTLGLRPPRPRPIRARRARVPRLPGTRTRGRWSALPRVAGEGADVTRTELARARALLARHGVVTRGAVTAERLTYGPIYRSLAALEERGHCRRGYFADGLGASQFATAVAVDRLRALDQREPPRQPPVHVLAASDPANPFGAALPWPSLDAPSRPARKAGAVVILVGGSPVAYLEPGGIGMLAWPDDGDSHAPASASLVEAVHAGRIRSIRVRAINGRPASSTHFGTTLMAAGAHETPSGLRIR